MVLTRGQFCHARDMLRHGREIALRVGEIRPRDLHIGAMLEVFALLWQLPNLQSKVDILSAKTSNLV
jgi:phosphotransferase system enzyme I (PtsP)